MCSVAVLLRRGLIINYSIADDKALRSSGGVQGHVGSAYVGFIAHVKRKILSGKVGLKMFLSRLFLKMI